MIASPYHHELAHAKGTSDIEIIDLILVIRSTINYHPLELDKLTHLASLVPMLIQLKEPGWV